MADGTRTRTARCACGRFRLELGGEPIRVYACACQECQRVTGSAFAYRAMFNKTAMVSQDGGVLRWRRPQDPGSWIEHVSCAHCGTLVYQHGEGLGDRISVSVGSFNDQRFPPPAMLHFASRRHDWLTLAIAHSG